jgi:hypothetical protein
MELYLASLHIWEIMDEMEEAPGLEANMKEQRDFKRRTKEDIWHNCNKFR